MVGICFRIFVCVLAYKFSRDSLSSLFFLVGFGEERNTSITKSQRSRAGIPTMSQPATREITSASIELCETKVCLLHIQLIGTKVLPNMQRIPSNADLES